MKFCQDHWSALKQAIEDKGMFYLVAKSDEDAVNNLRKDLKGEFAMFDPLMSSHNMIVSNAMAFGGLKILSMDESGNHYCPLCEVKKHIGAEMDKEWIENATNGCLGYCKENNLLNHN